MKKFLFLSIAATAMLASCTKDEMVEVNPQNAIGFETFVDKSTRAAVDVTKTNLTAFEVYGWRTKDTRTEQIFNAQEVTANNGVCTYSPLQYWVGGYNYTFEAIAPKSGNNGVTFNAANGASTITFVSDSETDLIYATESKDLTSTTNLTKTPEAVGLVFNHLLSRVKFSFVNGFPANSDVKLTVTDVKINDAGTTAILTATPGAVGLEFNHLLSRVKFSFVNGFPANSDVTLTVTDVQIDNAGTTATYTTSNGTWGATTVPGAVTFASDDVENIAGMQSAETEHKYLIPADIKAYTVTFTVEMKQGGVTDTFYHTVTLSTDELLLVAGNSYNLTATLNKDNINPDGDLFPIEFTATVSSWGAFTDVTIP